MSALLITEKQIPGMGKKKVRVDLRAEEDWVEEVTAIADRLGLTLSAYIRQAVTRQIAMDKEALGPEEPSPARRKK